MALVDLLGIVLKFINILGDEGQQLFKSWLSKHRAQLERELPDAVREIDDVLASHDDVRVSQLLHRLREAAK